MWSRDLKDVWSTQTFISGCFGLIVVGERSRVKDKSFSLPTKSIILPDCHDVQRQLHLDCWKIAQLKNTTLFCYLHKAPTFPSCASTPSTSPPHPTRSCCSNPDWSYSLAILKPGWLSCRVLTAVPMALHRHKFVPSVGEARSAFREGLISRFFAPVDMDKVGRRIIKWVRA